MNINIRPLAFGVGAEVTGISIDKPLDSEITRMIRTAWIQHLVLVFPDAEISSAQHIEFSKEFGELEVHPYKHWRGAEHPEIIEVTNRAIGGKKSETADVGRKWHSDGAYTLRPPTGSLLHCRAIPHVGGTTWFTNMYMAYDTLSEAMKAMIEKLEVVNDVRIVNSYKRDPIQSAEHARDNPPVVQPMVLQHPESGRKALYLSETVTRRISGMSDEESAGLLEYLFRHSARPEFIYRHSWKLNDLVMWDNRCTMHLAPADYAPDEIRQMYRTTLLGEPRGRLDQANSRSAQAPGAA